MNLIDNLFYQYTDPAFREVYYSSLWEMKGKIPPESHYRVKSKSHLFGKMWSPTLKLPAPSVTTSTPPPPVPWAGL